MRFSKVSKNLTLLQWQGCRKAAHMLDEIFELWYANAVYNMQAAQAEAASLSVSLRHEGHVSQRTSEGNTSDHKRNHSLRVSPVAKQAGRLPTGPRPLGAHQQRCYLEDTALQKQQA